MVSGLREFNGGWSLLTKSRVKSLSSPAVMKLDLEFSV